ncbi:hypothetical protein EVAR_96056_1 [Eumeta japonica]|uniref:Uncharacterized protein n=1 Tax=Eumeta variegata TaxID=151549 RepID=A0A4C1W7Q1_EUMVA|nr:hypothetical protein EVAR_96056_1 [Eumeta japonica]
MSCAFTREKCAKTGERRGQRRAGRARRAGGRPRLIIRKAFNISKGMSLIVIIYSQWHSSEAIDATLLSGCAFTMYMDKSVKDAQYPIFIKWVLVYLALYRSQTISLVEVKERLRRVPRLERGEWGRECVAGLGRRAGPGGAGGPREETHSTP